MFAVLSSVKGGVGTSVTSAALALLASRDSSRPTYLVDLAGDQSAINGLSDAHDGLDAWLTSPDRRLTDLTVDITPQLRLVPSGSMSRCDLPDLDGLTLALDELRAHAHIVIDAGCLDTTKAFESLGARRLLVIRPCYVALRAAVAESTRWDGVIVVRPPDRVLTTRDVVNVCGLPLVADIPMTADISRAVDAGVLPSRLPAALDRALRPVVGELVVRS
jgi:hypothetical protein